MEKQNMKKKPVTIRTAWIKFGGVVLVAIIGLVGIYLNNNHQENTSNITVDKNSNSPLSGKVENQTNSYIQIENMTGGVAVGNVEMLNITTEKEVKDLLPFDECFTMNVSSEVDKFIIEIKVIQGEWSPFCIGIPSNEESFINPLIYDSKSSTVPGMISFQSKGGYTMYQYFTIDNDSIKYWISIFQEPIATINNSYLIRCDELPSRIIFGVYPDNIIGYNLENTD